MEIKNTQESVHQFDVFWVDLDPTLGAEMKKVRPAVIVSPDELNEFLHTVIIAPLTSVLRGDYAFRPEVCIGGKTGEVVIDQVRAIDKKRLQKKLGKLSEEESKKVLSILQEMFGE